MATGESMAAVWSGAVSLALASGLSAAFFRGQQALGRDQRPPTMRHEPSACIAAQLSESAESPWTPMRHSTDIVQGK